MVRNNVAIGTTGQDEESVNLCRGLKERSRKIMGILYKAETENIPDKPEIDTDSCEVIEIKSWQVEQAINMFNSPNSDGLPLYDADIISAKLYAFAEKNRAGEEFTNFTAINADLLKDPIGSCSKMINLAKIWEKVSDYPIMQVLLKFNDNTRLFLASYFHRFKADALHPRNFFI